MVFITDFPDEIIEQILFKLSPYEDLNNCAVVCRRWSHIVHSVRRLTTMNLLKGLADTRTLFWQPNHDHNRQPTAISNRQARASSIVPAMPGIAARFSHAAVVHDNAMYVFGGGSSSSTTFNDLWRFDLSRRQWHRPLTTGTYPTPKACASIVVHRNRLVVFGGWRHPSANQLHESWQLFNELHVYDIAERKWTLHSSTDASRAPPPMTGHSATVHGDRMVVFGGFQQQQQNAANRFAAAGIFHDEDEDDGQLTGSSNSVWCLDLVSYQWQEMRTTALKPPPRYGQYQVRLDDDRLLVMGGCGGPNNMFNDAWVLRMTGAQWQWQTVRIDNRKWTATYMWCNPACRIGSKLILLGPATSVPSDLHLMKPTVMVRDNDLQNRPNVAHHNNHHHHHHHQPVQNEHQPPLNHARQPQQPQPAAVAPIVAPVAPRTPIQICEEANRRLQIERNKRPQPPTSSSHAQRNRPGPSSGVLVRRTAADKPHEDDEEAVNRRLKRNLQLKSRDDDLEQFLPKRFNQPHPEPLGMSAFSVGTDAANCAGGSNNDHHSTSSSHQQHAPQQQERRLQSLRRMEEKIRSIQNHVADEVAAPVVPEPEPQQPAAAADLPAEAVPPQIVEDQPAPLAPPVESNGQTPRAKRDCIGVFVCDISALLSAPKDDTTEQGSAATVSADQMVLNWVQSHNGGLITGAPERLILSSLVAGNGELIMFGGLRKESLTNAATTTQVSNSVHFLTFKRDIL